MPLHKFIPPWLQQRSQQKYVDESESDAEAEKMPLADTEWSREQLQRSETWYRRRSFWLSILASLFIVQNLVLLTRSLIPPPPKAVPEFPLETIITEKNDTWEEGVTLATNRLWESYVPSGNGWVQFANPHSLGLPDGLPSGDPDKPNDQVYVVTWGHQYHCLKVMRKAFWEMIYLGDKSPLVGTDRFGKKKGGDGGEEETPVQHLNHCFDYLRQTIGCSMDLTIETRDFTLGPDDVDIDGYQTTHKCKSREQVGKWLHEHAPPRKFFPYTDDTTTKLFYSHDLDKQAEAEAEAKVEAKAAEA